MEGNGETGKDCDLIRPAAFILHIIRIFPVSLEIFIDSTVMSTFNQVFFFMSGALLLLLKFNILKGK